MESLLLLAISLVGLAVFVAPIVSLVGFFRTRKLRAQVDALAETVARLERRVRDLSREHPAAATPTPATAPDSRADIPAPPSAPIPPPATPVAVPVQARPASMPSIPPPVPPAPPPLTPPQPPAPPAPAFDWESLLGIRGAAWLGGITLVMAALFFAKWSIDQGLVSPTVRVVLLLLAGSGALVWSELKLRDGYGATANAVSGAGVVTLYAAFVAAHSLYQLIALPVAFAGMSIVTVTAAVIAVRHLARFTALIGLVGGLATPVLLSTGVDRPVAFFSYLTVLAVGFLHVAERRQWSSVTGVALVGTTLLQFGWYVSWMAPGKLAVASAAFAALGAAYLWHAVRTREREMPLGHQAGLAGSLVPLGFVLLVAGEGRFVDQWAGIGGFLALVALVLAAAAVRWRMPTLVAMPAVATGLALHVLGGTHAGHVTGAWGLTGLAVALTVGYNLLPRATGARGAGWLDDDSQLALLAGAAPLAGLLALGWWMADGGRLPVLAFLALLGCAVWVAFERTRGGRWPGVFGALVTVTAISSAHWVEVMAGPQTYLDHLTIPHLLAAVVASLVVLRLRQNPRDATLEWWRRDACAVIVTAAIAYWSALRGLDVAALPAAAPYFALAGLDVVLVVGVAIRTGWVGLVPASAAAALIFNAVWHGGHFEPATALASLVAYAVTYTGFLALPFVVSRGADAAWKARAAPWLAAALVGPASFPVFYDAWLQLAGRAWVGIVPVGMAAVSVAALYAINQAFQPSADEEQAARRLNYLALFAAIALGFIAAAVPLQLQRQWITLGWALEAAAVWWLFGRLPHAGLKYFGLALYLAVGARLLANPEVLQYEPRGRPILNWLLYTYGVPALCCLAGVSLIRTAEGRRGDEPAFDYTRQDRAWPGPLVGLLGVLLVFWLINLEIADYFSAGRYVEFDWSRHLAQDLTRSFAWGLYALALLGVGIWRVNRGLRLVSLGFLLLTVAKVFLYDLGQLTGLYRILSFLALGVSLIMVSLLYQRFVRNREVAA